MGEWTGCEGKRVGQQGEREHLPHRAACQSGINFENMITFHQIMNFVRKRLTQHLYLQVEF